MTGGAAAPGFILNRQRALADLRESGMGRNEAETGHPDYRTQGGGCPRPWKNASMR